MLFALKIDTQTCGIDIRWNVYGAQEWQARVRRVARRSFLVKLLSNSHLSPSTFHTDPTQPTQNGTQAQTTLQAIVS
jgi:hypothetical protein